MEFNYGKGVNMMNRLLLSVAVVCQIALVSRAFADHASPIDLAPVIEPVRAKYNAPAVSAAVVRAGKIAAVGATGVRSLKTNETVAVGDRSLIGSCGKSATRLLIGRLVDKGKLRWDSTLGELLPDVSMLDDYKSVTVGDIIAHRGGLQPYTMINPTKTPAVFAPAASPREGRAGFIQHLLSEKPAAAPKSKFVYSNAGYGLLGHIAERLSDKPYEQLMRDEVFRPLDMKSAMIGGPGEASNIAGWAGHLRQKEVFEPAPVRTALPAIAPAGMMSMSIEDFAKLAAALIEVEARRPNDFLGAKAIDKLPELRPGSAGEGEIFFGGDGHYTAAFALWPSKGLGIVVESNAGDSDDLCRALIKAVREHSASELASVGGPQPADVDRPRYGIQLEAEEGGSSLFVAGVESGSVAQKGGLKEGDKITAINGTPFEKLSLDDQMAQFRKSPLTLKIDRDGNEMTIQLKLP